MKRRDRIRYLVGMGVAVVFILFTIAIVINYNGELDEIKEEEFERLLREKSNSQKDNIPNLQPVQDPRVGNHKSPILLASSIGKSTSIDYFTDSNGNPIPVSQMPQSVLNSLSSTAKRADIISPSWIQRAGKINTEVYDYLRDPVTGNPGIYILEYSNANNWAGNIFSRQQSESDIGEDIYLHIPLTPLDPSKRVNPRFHNPCNANDPTYDKGSKEFVDYFIQKLDLTINNGADGLWVDNGGVRPSVLEVKVQDFNNPNCNKNTAPKLIPLNPRTGTQYTRCERNLEQLNFALRVRKLADNTFGGNSLLNKPLMFNVQIGNEMVEDNDCTASKINSICNTYANHVNPQSDLTEVCNIGLTSVNEWDVVEAYGGFNTEGGGWFIDSGGPETITEWKFEVDTIKEAMSRGLSVLYMAKDYDIDAVYSGTSTSAYPWPSKSRLMLGYTSALMGAGKFGDRYYWTEKAYGPGWPGYDIDIGYAQGDYSLWPGSNNVYYRVFGKALVLANPSGQTQTIDPKSLNPSGQFTYRAFLDESAPNPNPNSDTDGDGDVPEVGNWIGLSSASSSTYSLEKYNGAILVVQGGNCNNNGVCNVGETIDSCSNDCNGAISGCTLNPGHEDYCADLECGPCSEGNGDCDNDGECESGLICPEITGTDFCVVPSSCTDVDGDGYGIGCVLGSDCDDSIQGQNGVPGNQINLGASEICTDNVDNDCDGDIDLSDVDCNGCFTNGNKFFTNQPWTIVSFGDTQHFAEQWPNRFTEATQWMVDNEAIENIILVINQGDIVKLCNDISQWVVADSAYQILDNAGIMYSNNYGNHDFKDEVEICDFSNYDSYFGPSRFNSRPWFGGSTNPSTMRGHNFLFEVNNQKFMLVTSGYQPLADEEAFVMSSMVNNPNRKVIFNLHDFLKGDKEVGETLGQPASYDDQFAIDFANNYVLAYPNTFLTLSGSSYEEGFRFENNIGGNKVTMLTHNFQGRSNTPRDESWIRLYTFDPINDRIDVKTYSISEGIFETDSNSQFSVDLDFDLLEMPVNCACVDVDSDGYGAGCVLGPDCRDDDENINPGKFEICDGNDNDCDSKVNYFDACAFIHVDEADEN